MKYVLAIAGSDSSGGAGIQADIKTINSIGAHPLTAITAVTAQSSLGITAIHKVPVKYISQQIETVINDVFPDAVKIGMLLTGAAVRGVTGILRRYKISNSVLDPVFRASTGRILLNHDAVPLLKEILLPHVKVITPNMDEAGLLTGRKVRNMEDMEEVSMIIKEFGPDVVVTGGHLEGRCVDILYDGKDIYRFHGSRLTTGYTHGTGCVFSASLATCLAMGDDVPEATRRAHDFVRGAIKNGYPCGKGRGVVRPG